MPVKRSVSIDGHRTSFSIEDEFWELLREAAEARGVSVAALVQRVDRERGTSRNLSSALRLFVLDDLKRQRDDLAV